ncbi:MAG TPA: LysR substrate-binding domain-containing protein [Sediminibacterium sp.]|nr:LysR substrate-binding domain-containing protein [Sediminibacterium sp.]
MISTRHTVFLAVASQKSFSKASQQLYISQPAISKHIRSLEVYYKTQLFTRKGISIELTEAGRLLLESLLEVQKIQERTEFRISSIRDVLQARGELKLGASTTVALYILPKVLSTFNELYPNIQISLLNRNSEIVLEALLNQEINLGITEGKSKLTQVDYIPFLTDQVVAVCSRKSPIARRRHYQVKEITGLPIAVRERGSGTLAALRQALEKHKIRLHDLPIKVRLGGTEALKNFLIESESLGFLPHRSVTRELERGDLVEIQFEGLHIVRNFYFIQRKSENSELNKSLIKLAQKLYKL